MRCVEVRKRVPSTGGGGEYVEITPPYFSFQPSIRNGSQKTLVVTGLIVEIFTKQNKSEIANSKENFIPSDCVFNKHENPCGLYNPDIFAVFPPNSTMTEPVGRRFYVGSLPDNGGSYIYKVNVEVLGFLSHEFNPVRPIDPESDHFKKVITFTTE